MGFFEIAGIIILAPILWAIGKFFLAVMIFGGLFAMICVFVFGAAIIQAWRRRIRVGRIWPQ